jgi:hypothetical protein
VIRLLHNQTRCPAACLLLSIFLLWAAGAAAAAPAAGAPPAKGGAGQKPAAPVPLGAKLKVVPAAEGGAEQKGRNAHNPAAAPAAGVPPGTPDRNPFAATGRMTGQGSYASRSGLDFTPSEQSGGMPKMYLRGHLQGPDGKAMALLEIEGGGVYMVREKDTVGLQELGIEQAIRIKKITRLHVVVEAGSLGRLIIVH